MRTGGGCCSMVRICTGEVWVRRSRRSRERAAFLIGDDEGILRIARGMARREVHALEVVEVGFDLGTDADGVAQGGENTDDFVERARDGVLGTGEAARAGQSDVDGLGGESSGIPCPARTCGLVEKPIHQILEDLETLAYGLFRTGRRGLEPRGDIVEAALLAAYPAEAVGLHRVGSRQLSGLVLRLPGDSGKGLVESVVIERQRSRNCIVGHCVKLRINHSMEGARGAGRCNNGLKLALQAVV